MLFRAIKHQFTKDKLLSTLLDEGYPFRPVELENLAKILTCGTSLIGGRHYQCSNPDCPHEKIISMSCKSRLCNSCGQKATENWIRHQGEVLPDCGYRHLTFTMPNEYWELFRLNRHLLGDLFRLSTRGLRHFAKEREWLCGIFAGLHTYGLELSWHPHMHVSVAELAVRRKDGELRYFKYPFRALMAMWRYSITKLLRENFGKLVLPEGLAEYGNDSDKWNKLLDHHYHRRWHVHIAKETT